MKLFKPITFSLWQIAIFKLSLIAFGILIGVTWQNFWLSIIGWVWVALIVAGISVFFFWFKQMKK